MSARADEHMSDGGIIEAGGLNMKTKKVPVTERALLQRINRKLSGREEKLLKLRGRAAEQMQAPYVVVCCSGSEPGRVGRGARLTASSMVRDVVDPASFGRELGVLRPWEEVSP
jgi:hypothetical protein